MNYVIAAILLLVTGISSAQTIDTSAVDGRIYLRVTQSSPVDLTNYNNSDPVLNLIISTYGITNMWTPFPLLTNELDRTYEVEFSQQAMVNAMITELELLSYIEYAEKKPLFKTSFVPDDIQGTQWGLTKINAVQAWDISTGSASVKIAIVDNAVSTLHEDLQVNIYINTSEIAGNGIDDDLNGYIDDVSGYDVADGDGNPNPPASAGPSAPFVHGTHCAGTAAASTDNGVGIASIGFNTTIIPVKCTPDNSSSQGNELPNAYDGVYYGIRAGADVISMSWGGGFSTTGESIMSAASSLGIVLVAAAGNNDSSTPFYPAAYAQVISVGATDISDTKSSFSNYGTTIDVMAPGSGIYSTVSGNGSEYGSLSGTSMACPLVAGLCALVIDQNPSFSPAQVKAALQNGCDNIDALNPSYIGMMGAGRINAYQTLAGTSGLIENDVVNSTSIYPNPNNGKFTIVSENTTEIQSIQVSNMMGQVMANQTLSFVQNQAEVGLNLASGVYVVKIISNSKSEEHLIRVL